MSFKELEQPRFQGLSSNLPELKGDGGKIKDPGNEVVPTIYHYVLPGNRGCAYSKAKSAVIKTSSALPTAS